MAIKIAVIYRPQLIDLNGPVGFSCPRSRPKGKGADKLLLTGDLEMLHVWLIPGNNFFSLADQWEPLMSHPATKNSIENFMHRGAILIKKPQVAEGTVETDTTIDYSDLQDAGDLIRHCNDAEWLRRCLAKDNRPQVDRMCLDRIADIERIKNKLMPQAV